MSEPSNLPASAKPEQFANLLAAFSSRAGQEHDEWDLSALADDVATISYEQALRANRRVRQPEYATKKLPIDSPATAGVSPAASHTPSEEKKRRVATITLRLTASEHAQLQERASAAQLSVSAYLRSCVFEAESLRAQVKEALSRMQSASVSPPVPTISSEDSRHTWRTRFFPRWSHRRAASS